MIGVPWILRGILNDWDRICKRLLTVNTTGSEPRASCSITWNVE